MSVPFDPAHSIRVSTGTGRVRHVPAFTCPDALASALEKELPEWPHLKLSAQRVLEDGVIVCDETGLTLIRVPAYAVDLALCASKSVWWER